MGKSLVVCVTFAVLSHAANMANITLFNSISFIFGTIFALLAVRMLGLACGVFVAFVGALYTVHAWGHYYALVAIICEVAFVGYFVRRYDNIAILDIVYWALIGSPIIITFYSSGLGLPFDSAIFIALKQAVNGVLNAVIAGLLLIFARLFWKHHFPLLTAISLNALMFKVIAFVGVASSALLIATNSQSAYRDTINATEQVLYMIGKSVGASIGRSGDLNHLSDSVSASAFAAIELSRADFDVERDLSAAFKASDGSVVTLYGTPKTLSEVGEADQISDIFSRWSPSAEMPEMQRSLLSKYVLTSPVVTEEVSGELVLELSSGPIIDLLEDDGRRELLTLAGIMIAILSVSQFLVSFIVQPLKVLSSKSSDMTQKIISGSVITGLPEFHILELDELSKLIGAMSNSLSTSFRKQEELARELERRVMERTRELALMSSVAQQTTNAVIITDKEGRTTWVNNSFERLTGFASTEIVGRKPGSILQRERPPEAILDNMREGIARASSFHVELLNHKKDGTPYWVEIQTNPMVDEEGLHTGFLAIETDVTERRNLTESLSASLKRLQLATEAAGLGVWELDRSAGHLKWDELCFEMHGLNGTPTEHLLDTWLEGIDEQDRVQLQSVLKSSGSRSVPTTFEYRFNHPDHGPRFLVASWYVQNQSDGSVTISGVTRDVTKEREAQKEIEEAASQNAAILDNVIDAVLAIDIDGYIVSFNNAAEKMFGYAAEEVIGSDVSMLMTNEHAKNHRGFINKYVKTGRRTVIGRLTEFEALKKDGTLFPILLAVTEVTTSNRHFFIGIIRDATQEKQLQDQLRQAQKLEAVGQLTGGISHDFNNLLTVIVGSAEVLIDSLEDRPDLLRPAEMILTAAESGALLTNRLLAFARRQALEPKPVQLSQILEQMSEFLRRSIGQGITIEMPISHEVCTVELDVGQFESAILNLALNARDAMPEGGRLKFELKQIHIQTQADSISRDLPIGRYLSLEVIDTGTGMNDEQLLHAFEPFYTTKDVGRGSGLGLSMVFGFVKQSGGYINIRSEVGRGTSVELVFPCREITTADNHMGQDG